MKKTGNKDDKSSKDAKYQKGNRGGKNHRGFNPSMRGKQGRKDSKDPRINLDNARESRIVADIEKDSKRRDANDISDFNRNPELLKSAGSLPFAQILGNRYGNTGATVPGIMTITWEPGVGLGRQPVAYNKAMQQVYSYIVHANSRNYKYEYTDLAILIQAGIEVFTAISEAIRVYGVVKYYPEKNRYLADGLVKALGFNADDIRKSLGQMWFDINNLIMQTKQIWIPDVFPILHRWIRYNTYVYTDAPGDRSQMYAFVRNQYFSFNETASTTGSCLTPTTIIQNQTSTGNTYARFMRSKPTINANGCITSQNYYTNMNWSTFRDMVQRMIDKLVLSQDRGMIYGDILKAYGEEKIFAMKEIPVDYTVTPQYNAEILMQIENTTTFPTFIGGGFYQSQNELPVRLYQAQDSEYTVMPDANALVPGAPKTQILNMHMPNQPTPEAIMIATRMKTGALVYSRNVPLAKLTKGTSEGDYTTVVQSSPVGSTVSSAGSEIPTSIWIFMANYNNSNYPGTLWVDNYRFGQYGAGTTVSSTSVSDDNIMTVNNLELMAFDWHPFVYTRANFNPTTTVEGNAYTTMGKAYGDFDNYIEIEDIELSKLNETALYSVFGIPQLG